MRQAARILGEERHLSSLPLGTPARVTGGGPRGTRLSRRVYKRGAPRGVTGDVMGRCYPPTMANSAREFARIVRAETNGGVVIVRGYAEAYRKGSKRVAASAAKDLREMGFDPETVESLSDEEIRKRMDALVPPHLR